MTHRYRQTPLIGHACPISPELSRGEIRMPRNRTRLGGPTQRSQGQFTLNPQPSKARSEFINPEDLRNRVLTTQATNIGVPPIHATPRPRQHP